MQENANSINLKAQENVNLTNLKAQQKCQLNQIVKTLQLLTQLNWTYQTRWSDWIVYSVTISTLRKQIQYRYAKVINAPATSDGVQSTMTEI